MELLYLRGTIDGIVVGLGALPPQPLENNSWTIYRIGEDTPLVDSTPLNTKTDSWELFHDKDTVYKIYIPDDESLVNNSYRLFVNKDGQVYNVAFGVSNSMSQPLTASRPLTAVSDVTIPAPNVIYQDYTSVDVLRPGANWPVGITQLFLQIRTPRGVGRWVTVGSVMQNTGSAILTINNIEKCTDYEARWATVAEA
mgnify:CR=1 FL=1